ncbi:hypothetical protein [Bradyrhizobium sp. 164]|uniref:hypothetical protein n=1 Tax=Bradyrhizobium sp. 164 TaxID=2782637 RepID=UPI001FFA51A9|nr:hypothetical protein [Bradyrhizobium sp. 164]
MGGNWFGGNWFGGNWFGGNWAGGSNGANATRVFAMRADRPLAEITIARAYNEKFREAEWDADLRAMAIMSEFPMQQQGGMYWQAAVALPPPTYPVTAKMIDEVLVLAVAERPEALGEIVEEDQNFQLRWLQLLNITATSHPQTFLLMKIIARVGDSRWSNSSSNMRTRLAPACRLGTSHGRARSARQYTRPSRFRGIRPIRQDTHSLARSPPSAWPTCCLNTPTLCGLSPPGSG